MPRVTPLSQTDRLDRLSADVKRTLADSLADPSSARTRWEPVLERVRPLCNQGWTTLRIVDWLVDRKHVEKDDAAKVMSALYRWRRRQQLTRQTALATTTLATTP